MFCARLFICALWSPAGKGLTSWLSFVVSSVSLSLSHWYPGSGVVLDCIDSWSLQPYYFLSQGKISDILIPCAIIYVYACTASTNLIKGNCQGQSYPHFPKMSLAARNGRVYTYTYKKTFSILYGALNATAYRSTHGVGTIRNRHEDIDTMLRSHICLFQTDIYIFEIKYTTFVI